MVSFSNGSLSGEVGNKRPLENRCVPKYKPRKVSAIRDFPPGCGPNAVPVNLKPEENDGSEARIVEAIGVKNFATGEISEMAVLVESETVGNSKMTNKIEADGVKTAKVPELVKLHEIKNSEIQNAVGSSGVKSSSIEMECQANEAVNSVVDVDMTESLDALLEKVVANANGGENLMPNEVECHRHEAINNPIQVESAEPLDAMVGKVTTTVIDGFLNDVDGLIIEPQPIGVDKLNNKTHMTTDYPNEDTGVGGRIMLKELNVADLPINKELLLGSSQAISSSTSTRPKDKYRRRRVSAVRDFPPNCGRSVPLLTGEEKQMVSSGEGLPDRIQKVELEPEATMSRNISEGGAIGEETSQKECLDGLIDIHVRRETTEVLNDSAGSGQLGEEMEVTVEGRVMDSEECNRGQQRSSIEKMEVRQAVPQSGTASKAVVDTNIDGTGGTVGKEIVVYSPVTNFGSGNELRREVVHGLMAAPHCPWRKGKVALKNSDGRTSGLKVRQQNWSQLKKFEAVALDGNPKADCSGGPSPKTAFPNSSDADGGPGSLTFTDEEDSGAYDKCVPEITPISMFRAVDDNENDFSGSFGKDSDVYSPGENNQMRPSHSTFSSADEVDREVVHGLMAAPYCPWKKGKTDISNSDGGMSGKNKKKILSWRQKAKAVARRSTPKAKFSGLPSKKHKEIHISNDPDESPGALMLTDDEGHGHGGDFSPYSPASHKQEDFEVSLPPFGPNGSHHGDARNRVRDTLRLFNAIYRKLLQKEEASTMLEEEGKSKQSAKKPKRIDLQTAKMIKDKGKEVNTGKQILGQVPGVEVGDEFQYRVELAVVGVHRLYQAGIDWMKVNGVPVATSIVASGGYADDMENAEVLIYSGQGGNVIGKGKEPEDQKLERGNLALKNSISAETPVRVVRGWKDTKVVDPLDPKPKTVTTYVYDGLYTVKRCWTEKGPRGKQVFKFELRRNPGQPELAWKEMKKLSKSKRPGVCVSDISEGKERLPICAVNTRDDEKPPPFTYTSKMIYPDWYNPIPPAGCDCTGRCTDSRKCRCAGRNGGEIPYNRNGAIVESKPLVYECGPHCRCPPSCYNRVTQRGIRFQLDIFKTESRGWGVRPLTSIPSGSFICEYAGELLEDKEAEQRIGSDEYLFDIGQNYVDSSHKPEDQALSAELMEEGGYTIDACQYGNIGRFINHSCSPNLYAQNVIYDHDDMKMPHVMFFAMENIPPLQELTYHYNYSVDQIRDSNGNIKVKKCYCGTAECTGRMY